MGFEATDFYVIVKYDLLNYSLIAMVLESYEGIILE